MPEVIALQLSSIDGINLSNVLNKGRKFIRPNIQVLEEKGLRVDQKVTVLTKDPNSAEKSKFSGQEQEIDEIDPIGTDTMIVSQGQFS